MSFFCYKNQWVHNTEYIDPSKKIVYVYNCLSKYLSNIKLLKYARKSLQHRA